MSLKLLFVNASLTDGGSERAMSLVAQTLATRGHDVTMALVREKESTYPIDPSVLIAQFRYRARGKIGKSLERVRQLRSAIKSRDYDYVVCYMWDLNITTLIASLGLRKRVIVSERAFPGTSTRSRLTRLLEDLSYRLAFRIVYQTRDAQAFCPPKLMSRSVVVPNMVEAREADAYKGERHKRVVSIGRLGAQKNFPLLLRSFARFIETNPEWTLEIYGRGALENELRALADELGIRDSVVFAGYVDDIADRIRTAGMFVLSSDFEGISNAMSEAMALGLPVVCTDCPVGGASLLIDDRVSGLLVPVRDEDAMTAAMLDVGTDPVLAKTISNGAQASVARFTPERVASIWEKGVLC
ncbi:glycosyltransferase [Nesterenkonia sp. AY15]|uniref:glycosyltransferase n=1 Tax=Nesterenkonia sp. AY15 TaxID=2901139 RepID=UPI001F4D1D49|nr:glycosyltransferase [Nesterenkonia sp. AY15]MCH8571901.1 glycosyltransferase [Nesterenkonia sp. AY15]